MLIRRVARATAWTLAAVVLLAVVLYVVLVAINWRDEVPSAQALQMQRIIDDRPVVGDADNAYVFLLGLAVPEDQDPLAWGRKRMAFLDAFPGPAADESADLPGQDHDFAGHRTPSTSTLIEACRQPDQACWDELEQHPESVDQWLASEGWLLGRYLDLIRLTQWRESIPADARVSFPSYAPALDGQRLLLMKAWRHASRSEAEAARALLQEDLVFWRMVLRSSDILVSKLIATVAIERNFLLGNLALRELHAFGMDASPPPAWGLPIDRDERSMRRAFAGEWRFAQSSVRTAAPTEAQDDASIWAVAIDRTLDPGFKKQATINLMANNMLHLIEGLDVDLSQLPAALKALETPPRTGVPSAYNPVGDILSRIAYPAYVPYARRVADLEGLRRAVLLADELRNGESAGAAEVTSRITGSALKEPYYGASFVWDAQTKSITFQGLGEPPRGRHAVLL